MAPKIFLPLPYAKKAEQLLRHRCSHRCSYANIILVQVLSLENTYINIRGVKVASFIKSVVWEWLGNAKRNIKIMIVIKNWNFCKKLYQKYRNCAFQDNRLYWHYPNICWFSIIKLVTMTKYKTKHIYLYNLEVSRKVVKKYVTITKRPTSKNFIICRKNRNFPFRILKYSMTPLTFYFQNNA